jgi:hypothetical protein
VDEPSFKMVRNPCSPEDQHPSCNSDLPERVTSQIRKSATRDIVPISSAAGFAQIAVNWRPIFVIRGGSKFTGAPMTCPAGDFAQPVNFHTMKGALSC